MTRLFQVRTQGSKPRVRDLTCCYYRHLRWAAFGVAAAGHALRVFPRLAGRKEE
jgi:hypothetical protein